MRAKPLIAICSTLLFASSLSLAQSDEAALAAARQLGNEGIDLFEKGKYEPALDRLSRAYMVVRVPTLGLWLARALDKNGKLVEAAERYREVTRFQLSDSSPAQFTKALEDAAKELSAVEERIPSVTVTVENADPQGVVVVLNGTRLRSAFIGVPVPVNPGKVTVEGTSNGETVTESTEVKEREKQKGVVLRFGGVAGAAPPPAGPPPTTAPPPAGPPPNVAEPQPAASAAPPTADSGEGPGFVHTTLPWIALGVGAAGVIAGGVTGFIAMDKKKKLDEASCIDGYCATWVQQDVDSYNQMRTFSTIGFIVGGVGVAAGITLLLTAPSSPEQPAPAAARVETWVGPGSAGVRGVF